MFDEEEIHSASAHRRTPSAANRFHSPGEVHEREEGLKAHSASSALCHRHATTPRRPPDHKLTVGAGHQTNNNNEANRPCERHTESPTNHQTVKATRAGHSDGEWPPKAIPLAAHRLTGCSLLLRVRRPNTERSPAPSS